MLQTSLSRAEAHLAAARSGPYAARELADAQSQLRAAPVLDAIELRKQELRPHEKQLLSRTIARASANWEAVQVALAAQQHQARGNASSTRSRPRQIAPEAEPGWIPAFRSALEGVEQATSPAAAAAAPLPPPLPVVPGVAQANQAAAQQPREQALQLQSTTQSQSGHMKLPTMPATLTRQELEDFQVCHHHVYSRSLLGGAK